MRDDWKPPKRFRSIISSMYGAEGRAWLKELPGLVADFTARHGLVAGEPYRDLSYNFVVPADAPDADGTGGGRVLKIAPPGAGADLAREASILRAWDGDGAARLYDHDPELAVMVVERADPGGSAAALGDGSAADDREATAALARSMRALWRPVPDGLDVPLVSDYAEDYAWYADTFGTGGGGTAGTGGLIDAKLFDTAYGIFRELSADPHTPMLLHGDLHHDNLLRARRNGEPGWLAIDPKGLSGDPGFETSVMLWNPVDLPNRMTGCSLGAMLDQRLGVLAEELDGAVPGAALDRDTLRRWAIARGVLATVWDIQDDVAEADRPAALTVAAMLAHEA
ncbi:aminoglycoside phosphotransferase family protein [Yinghuangia soli]|uniref:Aminoglycoside phosphotransferase family protein n=1 Tax=Yinghuangia soli TaxID=2908204 RepID=A0AA41U3D9_9ACTN|nr:aminoglycoside phosphotransferase family protein [Yinghuangia soli]MCF2529592.1 aminoglycoside phosphotransferase family protein [Yinghuangia soli]